MGLSENPVSMMTCSTCRHAKQLGPVLCCLHPSEPRRDGPFLRRRHDRFAEVACAQWTVEPEPSER